MGRIIAIMTVLIASYSLQAIDKGKFQGDIFKLADILAKEGDARLQDALEKIRVIEAKMTEASGKLILSNRKMLAFAPVNQVAPAPARLKAGFDICKDLRQAAQDYRKALADYEDFIRAAIKKSRPEEGIPITITEGFNRCRTWADKSEGLADNVQVYLEFSNKRTSHKHVGMAKSLVELLEEQVKGEKKEETKQKILDREQKELNAAIAVLNRAQNDFNMARLVYDKSKKNLDLKGAAAKAREADVEAAEGNKTNILRIKLKAVTGLKGAENRFDKEKGVFGEANKTAKAAIAYHNAAMAEVLKAKAAEAEAEKDLKEATKDAAAKKDAYDKAKDDLEKAAPPVQKIFNDIKETEDGIVEADAVITLEKAELKKAQESFKRATGKRKNAAELAVNIKRGKVKVAEATLKKAEANKKGAKEKAENDPVVGGFLGAKTANGMAQKAATDAKTNLAGKQEAAKAAAKKVMDAKTANGMAQKAAAAAKAKLAQAQKDVMAAKKNIAAIEMKIKVAEKMIAAANMASGQAERDRIAAEKAHEIPKKNFEGAKRRLEEAEEQKGEEKKEHEVAKEAWDDSIDALKEIKTDIVRNRETARDSCKSVLEGIQNGFVQRKPKLNTRPVPLPDK